MWINLSTDEIAMLRDALHGDKTTTTSHTNKAIALSTKLFNDAAARVDADNAKWVKAAFNLHHRDGECEVDEQSDGSALISQGDEGAYVMAWVWVPNSAVGIEDGE